MLGHYYPPCPQPDLTLGTTSHTDSEILTVLMKDQTGGLQVKHGEAWVHVKPIHGAIVVNVRVLLQVNNIYLQFLTFFVENGKPNFFDNFKKQIILFPFINATYIR